MVTDQTSAHDALNGYIPAGLSLEEAGELRRRDAPAYIKQAMQSMVTHVRAMLEMQQRGAQILPLRCSKALAQDKAQGCGYCAEA